METTDAIIYQTRKWINTVVIGCNFCPFAAREMRLDTIRYHVEPATETQKILETVLSECKMLDENTSIETTLIILSQAGTDFEEYLDLVNLVERLIEDYDYEGIYQVASFHPDYRFAGSHEDDPSNYTNRSIYPMLHLLREESLERVIEKHPDPEGIPERNIHFAHEKGLAYMKALWEESKRIEGKGD
jgi:uncharacterized protein